MGTRIGPLRLAFQTSLFAITGALIAGGTPAAAQLDAWTEGTDEADDGATRDFYNRGAGLGWQQLLGDWQDRNGTLHGDTPWASVRVDGTDEGRYIEWDVTDLVRAWTDSSIREMGFFLRPGGGGGPIDLSTREAIESQRPELRIDNGGSEQTLVAIADTSLSRSTFQASGEGEVMRVGDSNHSLVRFSLVGVTAVDRATLRIYTTRQFGGGLDIDVHAVVTGNAEEPSAEAGIAAAFTDDEGLADHPDVVFFEGFENAGWADRWTASGGTHEQITSGDAFGFETLVGSALQVLLPEGSNDSLNLRYDFQAETGSEPDAIYMRYYLRFGTDWNQTVAGGKLPGISGTYGRAGWGGRRSDGTNGWSARGLFHETIPSGNVLAGRTPVGSYVYHADMEETFGDNFLWTESWGPSGRGGLIEGSRWVCLETYVRMNTPGETDGVLRAWVDGVPSFESTTMRFRTVAELHIERIWMNIYHGGRAVSPYDQHAFIDNVVVAHSYIGPMGGAPSADAGPGGDAGTVADSGVANDGGAMDGGTMDDGGSSADGSTAPPESSGGCCHVGGIAPTSRQGAAGILCLLSLIVLRRRHAR